MKVLLIRLENYVCGYAGETTSYDNVKAIKQNGNNGFELVISENWKVYGCFEKYRIVII